MRQVAGIPEQQLLLMLRRVRNDGRVLNISRSFLVTGAVDIERLADALVEVQLRHDALRMTGVLDQRRLSLGTGPPRALEIEDRSQAAGQMSSVLARAQELATRTSQQELEAASPALATRLVQLEADSFFLGVRLNHLVADVRSMHLLLRELSETYSTKHQPRFLPAGPSFASYLGEHAAMLRSAVGQSKADAIKRVMEQGHTALPDAPASIEPDGHTVVEFGPALLGSITATARQAGTLRSAVLFAAAAKVVAARSGSPSAVVASLFTNRARVGGADAIGNFAQLVPVPVTVSSHGDNRDVIRAAQRGIGIALSYQDFPCHLVPGVAAEALALNVFQVLEDSNSHLTLEGHTVRRIVPNAAGASRFPFEALVTLNGDSGRLTLSWSGAKVASGWARAFQEDFLRHLRDLTVAPDPAVSTVGTRGG